MNSKFHLKIQSPYGSFYIYKNIKTGKLFKDRLDNREPYCIFSDEELPSAIRELTESTWWNDFDFDLVVKTDLALEFRPRRTLLYIDNISPADDSVVFDIQRWNGRKLIEFPLSNIPEEIAKQLRKDGFLIADVNVDAEREENLFFRNFEAVPETDLD